MVPSTAAELPRFLIAPPPAPAGEWNRTLPFFNWMSRPPGSKVKVVLAPIRVMVRSLAVSSTRESCPVLTRSGALKSSFVRAGVTVLSAAATTFTSWMISVNVLSVSGSEANAGKPQNIAITVRESVVFMGSRRSDLRVSWGEYSTDPIPGFPGAKE